MHSLPVLDCSGCGSCCEAQGTPPFTRFPDDRPPTELEWDIDAHDSRYDDGLPCLWFDVETKLCRHYEHRPQACRETIVCGDESCLEFRENRRG